MSKVAAICLISLMVVNGVIEIVAPLPVEVNAIGHGPQ